MTPQRARRKATERAAAGRLPLPVLTELATAAVLALLIGGVLLSVLLSACSTDDSGARQLESVGADAPADPDPAIDDG